MILETGGKPSDSEATHHTSTTYYSRYGKYGNQPGKLPYNCQSCLLYIAVNVALLCYSGKHHHQSNNTEATKDEESGSGQWNRKAIDSTLTQKVYQGSSHDPLDF